MSITKKTALVQTVFLALSLTMSACIGVGEKGTPTVIPTEIRTVTLLDKADWKFIQDDKLTDAAALSTDTSTWDTVSLPHTWNANDAASIAQTTPSTSDYKRGKGWYRLKFDIADLLATHWLQFDGASTVTDVWLNGKKLGQHKGAFTAFRFDVTGKIQPGTNVLLVKTDTSVPKSGADQTAIIPLSGDFNISGGLYRSVSLVATPSMVHIALDDFGSSGTYARTMSITDHDATVNVRTKLKNDSKTDGSYGVLVALLDSSGKSAKVAQKSSIAIKAGAEVEVAQDLVVENAHFWNGLTDPYLYKLVVELKDSAGTTIDKVVQDFGIRTMHFDPNEGFFLNGKSVPLHGVNLHQDYLGKAWAISNADTDESLALIKEIGANTIRLAHYPHGQYTLQQADKTGFVVWAELPYVNQTLLDAECNQSIPVSLIDNARQQLQELIRQQYNHASIAMWSVGNEVATGVLTCTDTLAHATDTATPLLRQLHTLAKSEDPGRVTTMADHAENRVPAGGITDTWALNRYYMWYQDRNVDNLGKELDVLHQKYPSQPMGISEYGAGAAITHQTDNPLGGMITSIDKSNKTRTGYQPEGYASFVHEQNFAVMASRKFIWGTYVWNMFDFGSGQRHEGDIGGTNTKGLVTFDRKTRKDPFFFYKANWSKEPVTYLTGKRYTNRAYPLADVKVYSNADLVTLKLNGTIIGKMTATQCTWKTCEFKNVPLKTGNNTIVAEGSHAGKIITDTANWNLAADNASNAYIAAGQITTGHTSSTGHCYGSDNFFFGGTTDVLYPVGWSASQDKTPVSGVTGRDRALYDNVRISVGMSPFSYIIPVSNGTYQVTLGFLEPDKGTVVGGRVFDVDANGMHVIRNLDVLKEAGGHYRRAITPKIFSVEVNSGKLKLDFKPVVGGAVLSNIMVTTYENGGNRISASMQ